MQQHHHHHGQHHSRHGNVGGKNFGEDLFAYVCNFGNLAAAATGTVNKQVQNDSAFKWIKVTYYASFHGGATAGLDKAPFLSNQEAELTVNIVDAGSSRQLFSEAMPIECLAGKASLPFILPVQRIFEPNAVMQVTCTNFSAAAQYDNIFIVLWGTKIFDYGNN